MALKNSANHKTETEPDQETKLSRSAKKRLSHELQRLGERLASIPRAKRESLTLPPELTEALIMSEKIKSREGRRRQMQFIGKLMRGIDPEPIKRLVALHEKDRSNN